ncbi:helix-turn-helix domain-containing protein [uncultured Robinsoniella sp.]
MRWGKKYSLREFSRICGVSASQLSKLERGETGDLYYHTACKIAKALDKNLEDIFPY